MEDRADLTPKIVIDNFLTTNYKASSMKHLKTGQELKQARKSLKLSQDEFAEVADVARNTVANWEQLPHLPVMVAHGATSILTALEDARDVVERGGGA